MAEDKKTFIQGKMNQDIDDRILPNGEYRSAQNIQVTTSEGSDVGSIQNILGNRGVSNPVLKNYDNLETIGCFFDEKNDRIFYFVTNFECPNPNSTGLVGGDNGPQTADQDVDIDNLFCGIFVVNKAESIELPNQPTLLVQGLFLNFSKTNLITGVNLIDDLLFFTDGLNQPRKINIKIAENNLNHYDRENKISVAKFAPFMPPLLLDYETTTLNGNPQATTTDDVGNITNVDPTSSMELSSQNDFPEDFLREKFVRFSYRYKFIDGEYSTIAPFTQVCFIPKTTSYSITKLQKVFKKGEIYFQNSTGIADGMVNNVTGVNLNIILPSKKIKTDLDIVAIEILYKESDNNLIRAVELKDLKDTDSSTGVYQYKYKSTLPYKTLPKEQLTRVYDNVPLSAKAQEIISNRVVYGNYVEQRKLPNQPGTAGLNFSVGSDAKYDNEASFGNADFNNYYLHKEYPFHSIKQRRTYEVGVVLSDKFGRQSPVLTSTLGVSSINVAAKDSNFNSSSWDVGTAGDVNSLGGVVSATSPGNENYCGDALTITFNEEIPNAYAKGTFIAINNLALESFVYTNNVYKTFFATDPILQGGPQGGSGVVLGTLFYYATNFIPTPGITDFLYLDPTFQTVLTGHNKAYMHSGFNVANNTAQIHEVNLNLTTGAVESVSIISESIFQSDLIGASAPVLVANAGDTVNTTQPTMAVTPIQEPQLNNPYSLGPNSFLLTISNFTQTGVFKVGDYLKGQDVDFVKIIFIDQQGVNGLFFIYTNGPASLLYKNYTGSSDAPVFDLEDVDKYSFYKYNLTPHGWYSYRVVVKQPEQEYYNVYTPGAISFDNDKDENKTYIPIASDSINKITRDIEFTNTQEVGLSTSKNRVYPKVVPDGLALGKQSNSDLLDVVSIGTAKEQGLKNDNDDVFDFIYESSKNTIIAQLPYGGDNDSNIIGTSVDSGFAGVDSQTIVSTPTNKDIKLKNQGKTLTWTDNGSNDAAYIASFAKGNYLKGKNKDLVKIIGPTAGIQSGDVFTVECDGAIDEVSLGLDTDPIPATIDVKIFNYKYGVQDKISIFETKPFESVLDIYYETSTAGLVHELNEALTFPTTTKQINFLDVTFNENIEYFDSSGAWTNEKICTLQLLDQFENELTAGPLLSQIDQTVGANNISTGCQIISQEGVMFNGETTNEGVEYFVIILDPDDNKFKIKPNPDIPQNFVYYPEDFFVKYNFIIQVTNTAGESEQIPVNNLNLGNTKPNTIASPSNFSTEGSLENPIVFTFNASNGSSNLDQNQKGLFFVCNNISGINNTSTLLGFDSDGNPESFTGVFVGQDDNGNYLDEFVPKRTILIDSSTNLPIPELVIDNFTGEISLTDLYTGFLSVDIDIRVIDSDDDGIKEFHDDNAAVVGGLSDIHHLHLTVTDGLIVIESDEIQNAGSALFNIDGVNINIFEQNSNSFSDYNNYWTSSMTLEQQEAGMTPIPIETFGIFLFSYVRRRYTNTASGISSTIVSVAYGLIIDENNIPVVKKYENVFEEQIGINNFNKRIYANHWLAKSQSDPVTSGIIQIGGHIFATEVDNDIFGGDALHLNQKTDIDSRDHFSENTESGLFQTPFSEGSVDTDKNFWKPDQVSGSTYGNLGDFEIDESNKPNIGYFAYYNSDNEEAGGVAKPLHRGGDYLSDKNMILQKANDKVIIGNVFYNVLYEIKTPSTTVLENPYNIVAEVELNKVFLCRDLEL